MRPIKPTLVASPIGALRQASVTERHDRAPACSEGHVLNTQNLVHPRVRLEAVPTPVGGPIVSAPPVLIASTHTVDYLCARCDAILLHAEPFQVHNLVIHCTNCGSYNSTDE